eukprot:g1511.t1
MYREVSNTRDQGSTDYAYLGDLYGMPLERERKRKAPHSKLLNDETYSDVVFMCDNRQFYCHKVILAMQSDYFDRMFQFPGRTVSLEGESDEERIEQKKRKRRKKVKTDESASLSNSSEPKILKDEKMKLYNEIYEDYRQEVGKATGKSVPKLSKEIPSWVIKIAEGMENSKKSKGAVEDKEKMVLSVTDMKPIVLEAILQHFYGCLDVNDPAVGDIAVDLMVAADRYFITDLKEECVEIIASNLDCENVLGVLSISEEHSVSALSQKCQDFISENFHKVVSSPAFIELCKSRPELVQLLCARNVSKESVGKLISYNEPNSNKRRRGM